MVSEGIALALPAQRFGKEFIRKRLVVRHQLRYVGPRRSLRVEIISVEGAHPFQHAAICIIRKVGVFAFFVPGIDE